MSITNPNTNIGDAHGATEEKVPWWKRVSGIFADEPMFDSVMETIEVNSDREREEANRLADEDEAIRQPVRRI